MKTLEQIKQVYEIIKKALPTEIVNELNFVPPAQFQKGKSNIIRGRIFGRSTRKL